MKKINWLFLMLMLAMSCQDYHLIQDEENVSPESTSSSFSSGASSIAINGVNCYETKTFPLTVNGAQAGTVKISVDDSNITVTYSTLNTQWFLLSVGVFAGDCNAIPGSSNYPFTKTFTTDEEVRSYTFTIPIANLPSCGCISTISKVARYNPISSQIESFDPSVRTEYCNCDEPEQPSDSVVCPVTKDFSVTAQGIEVGKVDIGLDETSINVAYNLTQGEWFLLNITAAAGVCSQTSDPSGVTYTKSFTMDEEVRAFSYVIPLQNLPACGCLTTTATVARFNSATSQIESYKSKATAMYCKCDNQEEPDDKNLRTQTPGGWGAPPRGNNPGAYLHANFASAFPAGLEVGCDYTITLTSAQAITDFLPQGGTPSSLSTDYVNPVGTGKSSNNPKNVLSGHVVALTLSVTFDAWDEDFGESNTSLANAVVTQGQFEGWTVAEVLAEAEKVLGGCDSNYTPSEMTAVVSAINESFVDGTSSTGFLRNQ